MVRGVGGARRLVGEEGLVGIDRLLGVNPVDGVGGQVVVEDVGVLLAEIRINRCGALVDGRAELVGIGPEEAVEIFEAQARRP